MSRDSLIEDFQDKPPPWGWDGLIRLVRERRGEDLEQFAFDVMERLPRGGTFLDLAMSPVPESAFERLGRVAKVVENLRGVPNRRSMPG